jgi:hypothetical protein
MPERRSLSFESLDQVMPEVDRLLETGYTRAGNWTLGQICEHLSRTLRLAIEPDGKKAPWLIRATLGPALFRHVVRTGRMRTGIPAPGQLGPGNPADDREGVEMLRSTIPQALERIPASMEHPFFGRVGREDFLRLQCIHCAHHLSFLIPASQTAGEPDAASTSRSA